MERLYELMLILKDDLGDQGIQEVGEKITKKLESLEGKGIILKIWARERNLCFSLKSRGAEKKKYFKGCYLLINVTLDTEKLAGLKETIRLEERILRSIIFKRDESKEKVTNLLGREGTDQHG